MIILQQARQQVQRIGRAFLPILRGEENGPRLPRIIRNRTVVHHRHVQTVAVAVLPQIFRAQHFADFEQLIFVVCAFEERFATEQLPSRPLRHAYQCAQETPCREHIQRVIVVLHVDKQFWRLVVARRDMHVELLPRVVELRQTPVQQPDLRVVARLLVRSLVVDDGAIISVRCGRRRVLKDDVLRLHVAVENPVHVRVIERLDGNGFDLRTSKSWKRMHLISKRENLVK